MPRKSKSTSSNEHQIGLNKKSKDKPTYKIIVLGCGGVGKVSLNIPFIIRLITFWSKVLKHDFLYEGYFKCDNHIFVDHAEHVCSSVIDYLTGRCSLEMMI